MTSFKTSVFFLFSGLTCLTIILALVCSLLEYFNQEGMKNCIQVFCNGTLKCASNIPSIILTPENTRKLESDITFFEIRPPNIFQYSTTDLDWDELEVLKINMTKL